MKMSLKEVVALLEPMGKPIKYRTMFGGYGFFIDDVMFAAYFDSWLLLRANERTRTLYEALGCKQRQTNKRHSVVKTRYYHIPVDWLSQSAVLINHAEEALEIAVNDREQRDNCDLMPIRDLPNMTAKTERYLASAGIVSVPQLDEVGALAAFQAVKAHYSKPVPDQLLYQLAGAIRRVHHLRLPADCVAECAAELTDSN